MVVAGGDAASGEAEKGRGGQAQTSRAVSGGEGVVISIAGEAPLILT